MPVVLGPLVGALAAFLLFWALHSAPHVDPLLVAPRMHFWVVSGTSLLAAALALLVGVVGARAGDARVVFLSAGFAGLAGFFALHGLSTPGMLIGPSNVTPVAAQFAVLALAAWMVAAAHLRPIDDARVLGRLLAVWALALLVVGAVAMLRPELVRFVPVHLAPLKWGVTVLVLVLLTLAGGRFLEGYRLARSSMHLVMVHVVGWVAVTQLIMVLGEVFRLSWWLYHGLLLAAVMAMLITFARQMQSGTLGSGLGALLSDDAERRLAYGLRPEVRALVVATEAKDPYTAGHTQRVATYAVRLGRVLNLSPEELRVLAQAGVVHDVGKIEIPDAVLNKTARLEPEEYALIRQHPLVGERIGRALGLHRPELEVIRHHHERWDGQGYPDRLTGEAIPRLARILAVVDVYDAVTSARAYRPAWSREQALRHIAEEAGRSFDPVVARAWLNALAAPDRDLPDPRASTITVTDVAAQGARA